MLQHLWPAYHCEVPFPVAGGYGKNMAEEEDVYDDTPEAKAEFRLKKATFKGEFLGKKGIAVKF